MAITPETPGGINPPNDLSSEAASSVAAPNTLSSESVASVAAPNTLTSESAASIAAPNTLSSEAVVSVAAPNTLSSESAGAVAAPNTLTSESAASIAAPNTLTSESAASVAAPNTLTSETAVSVAAPNTIGAVAAAALPRTLTPMLKLNFAHDSYQQNGTAKSLLDIVTYSRASSATFINRQLNQYGQYEYFVDTDYVGDVENLLTYSEQFDNAAWVKTGNITTEKQSFKAPCGSDVYLVNDKDTTNDNGKINQTLSVANDQVTRAFSMELKKGNRDTVSLYAFYTGGATVTTPITVNLSTGAVIYGEGTVVPVGDGWYRVTILSTNNLSGNTSAQVRLYPGTTAASETGNVYASKAQFTESTKALPYVKTIDAPATKAFTETVRREYDPETGENLGALIEGGSTNLLTRSEQFDNSAWVKSSTTVTANATKAPDGTMSADKLTPLGSVSYGVYQTPTVTSGQEHTFSAYFKNIDSAQTLFRGLTTNKYVYINWTGNTITSLSGMTSGTTASYKKVGDFYRVDLTFTTASTTEQCIIYPDRANGTGSVYAWGAQLEQKPFATSYIRTEGAAVSRSADVLSVDNFSLPSEGSASVTADYIGGSDLAPTYRNAMSIDDGTSANRMQFYNGAGQPNYVYISAGGTAQASISTGAATDQATTATLTFKPNDFVLYRDGAQVGTGTSGLIPVTTKINIGSAFNGAFQLFGHIAEFSTYNTALTAQEVSLL